MWAHLLSVLLSWSDVNATSRVDRVILISVDGLNPAILAKKNTDFPAFARLCQSGACTNNARTEYGSTATLPNHVSMITGRPMRGRRGHRILFNEDNGRTVHRTTKRPVHSIFDVAHDSGLKTAFFYSHKKMKFIARSFPTTRARYAKSSSKLIDEFLRLGAKEIPHLSFVHLISLDKAGHKYGYGSRRYRKRARKIDKLIGKVLRFVESRESLRRSTAIIITSDHGGTRKGHYSRRNWRNFTIPFYVWMHAHPPADLYVLNQHIRKNPRRRRVRPNQGAIQNGDAANLALALLGLPPVKGSLYNRWQNLAVSSRGKIL